MSNPATRSTTTTLHVAFGSATAGTLRQAFRDSRPQDRVSFIADPLEIGPIAPASTRERMRWLDDELDFDWLLNTDEIELEESAWREVISDPEPIIWLSRQSSRELCGLHEVCWRRGRRPLRLVDVTDIDSSVGCIRIEDIVALDLVSRAKLLSVEEIEASITTWNHLKSDTLPLRIVSSTGLVSVPITHFDAAITALTTTEWQRCGRIVGTFSAANWNANASFVWARLRSLIADKKLEARGELSTWRTSEVRRAE